jgi:predicted porin
MNKFVKLIGGLGLLAMAFAATSAIAADGPLSYNYVQADVVHENQGFPTNGLNLQGSFDLGQGLYAEGSALDLWNHGASAQRYQAGLGYHYDVNHTVSFYGQGSAVVVDGNAAGQTAKYGFDGEAGARVALTPKVEVLGAVEVERLNLANGVANQDQTFGKVGVDYFLTKSVALEADFRGSAEDKQIGAGVRYTW